MIFHGMNLPSPCMSPSLLNPPRRVAQYRRHSKIDAWTLGEVLHQFERPPIITSPHFPFSISFIQQATISSNLHESALDAKNDVVVILTWCQTRIFRRSLRKIHRGRTKTKHLVDAMFPSWRHCFCSVSYTAFYTEIVAAAFQSLPLLSESQAVCCRGSLFVPGWPWYKGLLSRGKGELPETSKHGRCSHNRTSQGLLATFWLFSIQSECCGGKRPCFFSLIAGIVAAEGMQGIVGQEREQQQSMQHKTQ